MEMSPGPVVCPLCASSVPRAAFAGHVASADCADPLIGPPAKRASLAEQPHACQPEAGEPRKPAAGLFHRILSLYPVGRKISAYLATTSTKGDPKLVSPVCARVFVSRKPEYFLESSKLWAVNEVRKDLEGRTNLQRLSVFGARRVIGKPESSAPKAPLQFRQLSANLRCLKLCIRDSEMTTESLSFMTQSSLSQLRSFSGSGWLLPLLAASLPSSLRSLALGESDWFVASSQSHAALASCLGELLRRLGRLRLLAAPIVPLTMAWELLEDSEKARLALSLYRIRFPDSNTEQAAQHSGSILRQLCSLKFAETDCWTLYSDCRFALSDVAGSFASLRRLSIQVGEAELAGGVAAHLNAAFGQMSRLRHLHLNLGTMDGGGMVDTHVAVDFLTELTGLAKLRLLTLVVKQQAEVEEHHEGLGASVTKDLGKRTEPRGTLHLPPTLEALELSLDHAPTPHADETFLPWGCLAVTRHPHKAKTLLSYPRDFPSLHRIDFQFYTTERASTWEELHEAKTYFLMRSFAGPRASLQFLNWYAEEEGRLGRVLGAVREAAEAMTTAKARVKAYIAATLPE